MKNSTRIIFNTSILYGKMLITMVFSLLSTRWVLAALGETDFGIYNLVAGLVSMFAFLNTAMTVASQRYLSYAIGKGDKDKINETFYYSFIQHLFVGVIVFLTFELLGIFFLNNLLNIPDGKIGDATYVLHCLAISTFFTIIAVPYQALANSHENMLVIALISILESLLKFSTAILLLYYGGNRLKFYGLTFVGISLCSFVIILFYCKKQYRESHIRISRIMDIQYFKEFFLYAMWNLVGALGGMFKSQGIAMIMNVFFGVIANAAYGIANQINGQLNFFANTIVKAIQPQLIQNEGAGNRKKMLELSVLACKIPTLLLIIFVIPLAVKMDFVLKVWLSNPPEYSVVFCQLIIAYIIVYQSYHGIELSIHASGNIKNYQLVGYGIQLLVLPLGYILFKIGCNPESILYISLSGCFCNLFITMFYANKEASLNIQSFVKEYLLPMYFVIIVSLIVSAVSNNYIEDNLIGLIAIALINAIVTFPLFVVLLTNKQERSYFISFLYNLMNKLKHE